MQPLVLVLNAGSSSIKFQLFFGEEERSFLSGLVESMGTENAQLCYEINNKKERQDLGSVDFTCALNKILALYEQVKPSTAELLVIGHRVVHGGTIFQKPTLIDSAVIQQIEICSALAPLHNPSNLAGILAAQKAFPGVAQVAVFDTAFHHTMPNYAYLYALPYEYYRDYGVRRYGFHGISYQYLVKKAADLLNKPLTETKLICAHLGNGCSACAVSAGNSVDTTMGFTPLEGLMMGTRCGDLDPGLFSYLSEKLKLSIDQMTKILNLKSGLLGVSMRSMDMRLLEQAADAGDVQASLAIEMFCYRLAKTIAALSVPLGRIDALVFSGGIGENAVRVRKKTLALLGLFGFELDEVANEFNGRKNNGRITTASSTCALVIQAQEERMIAQQALQLIQR
jgi:acetate kinase